MANSKKIIRKWIFGAVWQNKDQTFAGRDSFVLSFFTAYVISLKKNGISWNFYLTCTGNCVIL
jgi:hypothetical protein